MATWPGLWPALALLFGLLVGSFLNVVIYRLPRQLQAEWRSESRALLELEPAPGQEDAAATSTFNIAFPASHCPHCQAPIKAWHNVPIISFLLLRGRCAHCNAAIGWRYPVVEALAGVGAALIALWLGWTPQAVAAILLTWALLALSAIDIDHQLLPDRVTLPLLWLGLALNSAGLFTGLQDAVWGAIAGYLSLWLVFHAFRLLTGKEGMGYGDFKLLAALGAWLGWQLLPLIILLSSLVGALCGAMLLMLQGRDRATPIPFGPYLAAAGWIALLWGDQLISQYLQFAGLGS